MLQKNILKTLTLPVLLAVILAGCATTVSVRVRRPPALNTAGIKRIAIMPFEAGTGSYREMAQYATAVTTEKIRAMNYFTLVDHSEIERLRRNNQNIENYVDALFIGRITLVTSSSGTRQEQYKNKDGTTGYYTIYQQEVAIEFNYSLMRSRDGSLIGPVSKKGSNSATSRDDYPSAPALQRAVIDRQLGSIGRDLAPYTAIENRTLAKDKSKDKVLQAEMKDALALVKAGSYKAALDAHLGIYERYGSFAAAENVSILHEVLGDTQAAADFMQQVYYETGNPGAMNVLARLNRILQDQAILNVEYTGTRNQAERVSAFASDEIQKVLPPNARVWIYNNAVTDPIAVAVVDNITSGFIRKGIGVVDRQNAALIETEQKFQMSGSVSDNDFVSIANAVGANTIVVIGITGTGAMRRLQVRVLDIEKRVPLLQSDTNEKWQL